MRYFQKFSVRTKLLSFFLVVVVSCGLLVMQSEKIFAAANDIATNWMPCVAVLSEIGENVNKIRLLNLADVHDPKPENRLEIQKIISEIEKERVIYEPMISSDQERLHYPLFSTQWAEFLKEQRQIDSLLGSSQMKAADELVWGGNRVTFDSTMEHINALIKANVDGGNEAGALAQAANRSSHRTEWAISVVLAAAGLGLWVFFSGVIRQLRLSAAALQRMAKRDLTAHLDVESTDEFGQIAAAVNAAMKEMSKALQEMNSATVVLSDASASLVDTSSNLTRGTKQSSSSLEETAASLEEMTSAVKQNSESAGQARAMSKRAFEEAIQANEVVQAAVDVMTEINTSSQKVSAILGTIDEIAFQTNLLAINAAIEANLAGSEGRGFGIVAQEVRMLAHRTAASAREIKVLLANSAAAVERGSESVNGFGATLEHIRTSIERVSRVMDEIAEASQEQATGIDHVSSAVAQIERVTQSGVEETKSLSDMASRLSEQASGLKTMVSGFLFERKAA